MQEGCRSKREELLGKSWGKSLGRSWAEVRKKVGEWEGVEKRWRKGLETGWRREWGRGWGKGWAQLNKICKSFPVKEVSVGSEGTVWVIGKNMMIF